MKLIALLFFILSAVSGKAWGYGLPAISVGEDHDLLTQTPITIQHLTETPTPTMTATPSPTLTPTATATKANPITIPTLTETITLPNFTPVVTQSVKPPNHSLTLDPSQSGLNSYREQGFFEVGLDVDTPIQGATVPGTETGVKGALGILFKDGLAVQLDLEYFAQSNTNSNGTLSENEVLILPTLRRYLATGNVRPYLSIGNGLAININTSENTTSSVGNFDVAFGGGFEFVFENYFSTYIEGKYNLVFTSASPNQDIPVVFGARLGL